MSNFSNRVAALSPDRRALFNRLLVDKLAGETKKIPPRDPGCSIPLSHTQNLMWMLHQIVGEASVYNSCAYLRLEGDLDGQALQRALDTILLRHEILRTNFVLVDGVPTQVVRDLGTMPIETREIAPGPEEEREAEIRRICLTEAQRRFDLAKDLLIRIVLLRLDARHHILLLLTNHIVFDGWSRKILYRELEALYSAFRLGQENPLPPLAIQYADFSCWQQNHEQAAILHRHLGYWKLHLAGAPQVLDLPSDRPRPAVQTFRGKRLAFPISGLIERLRPLAAKDGSTLFMAFIALLNVLLYRYTGREDILIGTPLLGRLQPEVEPLIGYFSNTLVTRTQLSGDATFHEVLARVRKEMLDAFDHQAVPLDMLTAELQPDRNPAWNPLFQIMASVAEDRVLPPNLPGLDIGRVRVDRGVSRLDLTMIASISGEEASVTVEYSTELFDAERIVRLIGHLETLSASVAEDPDRAISSLKMIQEPERAALLSLGTPTVMGPERPSLVHHLFERQAEVTPGAIAVESDQGVLTYRELNTRANQVARLLQRRGVGNGSRVGLLIDRSLEMIVGMLRILKSGAACVPLDVFLPKERLSFLIRDAETSLVLTDTSLASAVRQSGAEPICLDSDIEKTGGDPENNLDGIAEDRDAYVIYTSGSSGLPKGVLLTHRGLVNHILFAARCYGLTLRDRVLQSSPISFDISLEEILPVLASGGAVVLRPSRLALGGRHFLDWLRQTAITVMDLPTAFWHEWTWELSGHNLPLPPSLRLVIVGGEKADAQTLRAWRNRTGGSIRWINTYGPTEASVIATFCEPPDEVKDSEKNIPIGRPVDNVRIYILDAHREPVPLGTVGEMYIGGEGVARGYLNHAEMTSSRFIADPFTDDPGARLFKTGDLARFRTDGNIEFAGRADDQVKIRGYRVEPGEIESVLHRHAGVSEAAVVNRAANGESARLIAYVVGNSNRPDEEELRQFVRDRLPEYMVPAAFVVLPGLPKTSRGKLDRDALPAPDFSSAAAHRPFVAPRDEVELKIAKIWERVLGAAPIGVTDSFFERGGHSLLAVSMFAQIEKMFSRTLPLATLFEAQTVELLAEVLRKAGCKATWSSLVPIQTSGSLPPLYCVHAQSGHVLFYRDLASRLGPGQPFYGLQSAGVDGREAPLRTIEEMAARYLEEIRAVQPEGPYYLAGFCLGSYIAFEMARQVSAKGQQIAFLGVFDTSGEWRTIGSPSGHLAYHRKRMSALGLGRRLSYVFDRVGYRLSRAKLAVVSVASRARAAGGRPLPRRWTNLVLFELNRRANHDYVPGSYAGRIDYFQGQGGLPEDPTAFWGQVALKEVVVHPLPGAGRHMFHEPHVGPLAEALTTALSDARSTSDPLAAGKGPKQDSGLRAPLSPSPSPVAQRKGVRLSEPPAAAARTPAYQLRPAEAKDAAFIYDLRTLTMRDHIAKLPGWNEERQEAFCMDFDVQQHQIILVDGKEAGALSVIEKPGEVYAGNMHFVPRMQGKGLGTAVLGAVIADAHRRGLPVTAQVLKTNTISLRMCKTLGMEINGETEERYLLIAKAPIGTPAAGENEDRAVQVLTRRDA